MVKVVSVRFKEGGKSYYFAPGKLELNKDDGVIVETSKGLEYAVVVKPALEVEEASLVSPLKPVVRKATERDEEQRRKNEERHDEYMAIAQEKITARGLDMKPVDCEVSFDGSKITVYFSADKRVDFRDLIRDLSSAYHMRIELRQINIREEIQRLGGLAPCGRVCCCAGTMEEPVKVSVKMAKNQGLSLNPGKISGLCGRLMCCLAYENEYYSEVCKQVPKLGSEAETPDGVGTVINVNMLKMVCKVKFEKGDAITYRDYKVDEIRFKRGNVVMGKLEDDEDEEGDDADVLEEEPQTSSERGQERRDFKKDKHQGGNNNRQGGNKPRQDGNNNNNKQGGNKPRQDGNNNNRQNQGKPRPNNNGQQNRQGGGKPKFDGARPGGEGAQPRQDGNNNNNNNGQGGGKKHKHHRHGKPHNKPNENNG